MEDNQKKSDEGQDLKKQNMAMMFDRMLRKDKQCSYYTPISTMAKTERSTQLFSWDSMHHFSDNFLRFLPKTIQSPPDMHRKYWPEHLECKVLSLVKDKSINEAIHQKSYDNLLHILKGKKWLEFTSFLQTVSLR